MSTTKITTAVLVLSGALALTAGAANAKSCVKKAGEGTNSTEAGAKYQAWEAVLQATDWGMWSVWISGKDTVGLAPGYKVSGVRFKCKTGGLGYNCVGQATLCK